MSCGKLRQLREEVGQLKRLVSDLGPDRKIPWEGDSVKEAVRVEELELDSRRRLSNQGAGARSGS